MSAPHLSKPTSHPGQGTILSLWLGMLVFASGLCGISYEILYGRILGNLVGDQFIVSASILLTFMIGIGVGTLVAHRFWRWLWALEIGIGVCAFSVASATSWIEGLLYLSTSSVWPMFGCMAVLLVPSVLIGATLPLFAGYLQAIAPTAGFHRSYALYNFGAALTALLIEFWLLRQLGIKNATMAIGSVNLLVGVSLLFGFRQVAPVSASIGVAEPAQASTAVPPPWRIYLPLALASIASAVFQLTMIKVMECLLGPFRETFALVLTTILLGIAMGSSLVRRLRLTFTVLMWINLASLAWLMVIVPTIMNHYAAAYHDATATTVGITWLKFSITATLMLLPSITFGATIPALLGKHQDLSRQSGKLLFCSSLANAAGFLLMAFGLHRYLDYGMLIVVTGVLATLALMAYTSRLRWAQLLSPLLLLLVMRTSWDEKLLYVAYDSFHSPELLASTRATLNHEKTFKGRHDVFSLTEYDGHTYFFINGYISMPLNAPSERVAGAFSSLFAPRSDHALVLGVGSGATAGTVARLFQQTDAVEINEAVLAHLDLMTEYNFDLPNNEAATLHLDDALHYLRARPESDPKYALILNTVTSPRFFSSSKLYTLEALTTIKRSLASDGIFATYFDTRVGEEGADIMLRTLAAKFKHLAIGAIKSGYFFILCSDQPIKAHQPRLVADHPMVGPAFLEKLLLRPDMLPYALVLMDATKIIGDPHGPLNTRDMPVLDFTMARLRERGYPAFLSRMTNSIEIGPVQAALQDTMKFDPHQILFHLDNLLRGNPEVTRGWRRVLYAERGFEETHLRRERAIVARAAAHSDPALVHYTYANKLKDREDLDAAISEYQQVIALNPGFDNAHFNMAAVYEKKGDTEAAIRHYLQENEVDHNEKESHLRIARILIQKERYEEALPHLEVCHVQIPSHPDLEPLLIKMQEYQTAHPKGKDTTAKAAQ